MIICALNQISKSFAGTFIFENVSFEIQEGNRVRLVGRNGSGKTTIFQLITGIEKPDQGAIHIKKGSKVGYLSQIPSFSESMTVEDVLLTAFTEARELETKMKVMEQEMSTEENEAKLGSLIQEYGNIQDRFSFIGGFEMSSELMKVALGLQIESFLPQPFANLSGGEKTKVCLGLLLLQKPDLLLLDEPTNHLDILAVEWLEQFLKEYKGIVVVISHDRYFLDEVATKIIDLEDAEVCVYHTNYSDFVKEKQEKLLWEFDAYKEQQKKIKKIKEAIKRLKEWANQANPPNEGLHKRARNMERALERMEKLKRPILERKKVRLQFEQSDRSGKDVIILEGVKKTFGDKCLISNANLHVSFRDRVAIVGRNGTGKTTLLKLILNQVPVDEGKVQIGSNVKIGYLSQHLTLKPSKKTVLEVFREQVFVTEEEARHILANFLFYGPNVFKKVSQLSGGERMRLCLAQLMHQDINLLILDELTNHLDIETRDVLEEALEDFQGTILAVSHDRYFLNKIFTKTYWIANETLHGFPGSYDWAKKKLGELEKPKEKKKAKVETIFVEETQPIHEKQFKKMESRIESIEYEIHAIEQLLGAETDIELLQKWNLEKEEKEAIRDGLYKKLEELIELL
ncbi:ribosomal protection-like ABC-F family protein [Shimazuella alba]|uniref:ATP-binding cassette domain-containing protein n=1 Tax=Shimazuella alba TaxID=2690964 RepID=A0A6I4W0X1_9BACL|nr:ABC-F family ATP-binding cassette domain-containing protein [Shimazuella alba]MXQ55825.1 ATP-binding cassette domain-containing protein [Shimazuella alba]